MTLNPKKKKYEYGDIIIEDLQLHPQGLAVIFSHHQVCVNKNKYLVM